MKIIILDEKHEYLHSSYSNKDFKGTVVNQTYNSMRCKEVLIWKNLKILKPQFKKQIIYVNCLQIQYNSL